MDKDTSQLQLYQHFLSFFLTEGILDFFEPVWMETQSLDSRESKKDIERSTNASAESLNSKMKAFRAQLRGVSDLPFFMFRLCRIFG